MALRRPRQLGHLYEICRRRHAGHAAAQVDAIITTFADPRQLLPDAVVAGADTRHGGRHHARERHSKVEAAQGWVREESRSAEWYADLVARRRALPQPARSVSGRIPSLPACSSGGAMMAGTRRGPNSTGAPTIRLFERCCRSSTRASANRRERRRRRKSSATASCARRRPWRREAPPVRSCSRSCWSASSPLALMFYRDVAQESASWPMPRPSTASVEREPECPSRLRTLEAEQAAEKCRSPASRRRRTRLVCSS